MIVPNKPRYRITLGGTIGGQPWNTSCFAVAANAGVPVFTDLLAAAATIGGAFNTHVGATWKSLNEPGTIWDSCKLDYYAPSSNASSMSAQSTGFATAGTNPGSAPASQSVVASLYTATVSRSGRGRMFLPATGAIPGGIIGYGFDPTKMGTLANQMAAWLTSINVLLWPAPSLAAVVSVQSLTTGNTPAVTSVLCDTRPDRQEHREKAQSFRRFASVV